MSNKVAKLEPAQSDKKAQRLRDELESIESGLLMVGVGNAVRMKAFWNISRHRLYEADGHANMKDFAESTGFSYRRIKQIIQEGDQLAELVFSPELPEEKRILTVQHVKLYVEARKRAKLLTKHDTLRLPDSAGKVDQIDEDEAETQLELQQLAQEMSSILPFSGGTKQLESGDDKKDKRMREIEQLLETLENTALQAFAVSRAGGFSRATKKKAMASYYSRLSWWLLHNDAGNLPWITYESATAMMVSPETAPAHVRFAMGTGDE